MTMLNLTLWVTYFSRYCSNFVYNFRGAEPRLYPHRGGPVASPPELRQRGAAAAAGAAAGAPGSPRPPPAAAGQVIPLMGWPTPRSESIYCFTLF